MNRQRMTEPEFKAAMVDECRRAYGDAAADHFGRLVKGITLSGLPEFSHEDIELARHQLPTPPTTTEHPMTHAPI